MCWRAEATISAATASDDRNEGVARSTDKSEGLTDASLSKLPAAA